MHATTSAGALSAGSAPDQQEASAAAVGDEDVRRVPRVDFFVIQEPWNDPRVVASSASWKSLGEPRRRRSPAWSTRAFTKLNEAKVDLSELERLLAAETQA